MPGTGPVYQPTTVSYEQQNHWSSRPSGLFHNNTFLRIRCLQWLTLVLALTGIAAGLVMMVTGASELSDTHRREEELHETSSQDNASSHTDMVVIGVGAVLFVVGVALCAVYAAMAWRRRVLPWLLPGGGSRKEGLMMGVGGGGNGPATAGAGMNPSTDLLVASQYGPEQSRPPTEETRKLMASSDMNNCVLKDQNSKRKTSTADVNNDPFADDQSSIPPTRKSSWISLDERFYQSEQLEPKKTNIDLSWKAHIHRKASNRKQQLQRKAPLASAEEPTPSLRSSFDSLFIGNDFSSSGSDYSNPSSIQF